MKLERIEYLDGKKRLYLRCHACGNLVVRAGFSSVKAKTCGCVPHIKHGLAWKTPLYSVWKGMRNRCNNPKAKAFKNYGAIGISVCPEWNIFPEFMEWALHQAHYQPGLILDRRDNSGNYEPGNCRFVTFLESNRNRKFCITKEQASAVRALLKLNVPQTEIAHATGIKLSTVRNIHRGLCWKE